LPFALSAFPISGFDLVAFSFERWLLNVGCSMFAARRPIVQWSCSLLRLSFPLSQFQPLICVLSASSSSLLLSNFQNGWLGLPGSDLTVRNFFEKMAL
jgi:hypothetical protein